MSLVSDWMNGRGTYGAELHQQISDAIKAGVEKVSAMPLNIAEESGITPAKLSALVSRYSKQTDLVMVDYLQLMRSDNPKASTYDRVSEASRACQMIAMRHGIPVICAAQLNREGSRAGEEPQLWQLRESGQIEQDAGVVIMLQREKVAGERESPTQFHIRKNRDGRLGTIEMRFDLETQLIS
jgi:replicative DNA helicase